MNAKEAEKIKAAEGAGRWARGGGWPVFAGGRVVVCPDQSARGLAQSKTLARGVMGPAKAERLGARRRTE